MLLLVLLACTAAPLDTAPPAEETFHPPDARGPHLVGTLETEIAGPEGVVLGVQAWFPARETGEEPYTYDDIYAATALEDGVPACDTPRPVVVFSHGNSGMRWQSVFFTEHLASHGFLVVAPDHTYNTLFDYDEDRLGEVARRRPADVAAAFDWAVEASGAGGPLEGCVDPGAGYAVAGHSFGGFTSLAVAGATVDYAATAAHCGTRSDWLCDVVSAWAAADPGGTGLDLGDPRAWAAVPMCPAGYEVFVGGLEDLSVPILVLGGSRDDLTPMATQVQPIYDGLAARPRYLGEVVDAGHYSFSDACTLYPTFDDCAEPYLPPEEVHGLTNAVATALLQVTLGQEAAADWLAPEDERLRWTASE